MIDSQEGTPAPGEPDLSGQSNEQSDDADVHDRAAVGRFESF
ncbi:hypothetical protein ACIPYS_26350 [Kitasatospora sp. NPDC089913]|nr:hypothetical protein [Streptomyces sp. TLI_053]